MSVNELAGNYKDYVVGLRREFHMNPEIGMGEFRTQKRVMEELRKIGIECEKIAGTGVVAYIKGTGEGKIVALRADMDALEVREENDSEYKSQNDGLMHACGHDGHTAALLAAARILIDKSDEFKGSVKLLFQPGEEGAKVGDRMLTDGAVKDVDAIFGLHLWNEIEVGKVSVEAGPRMASAGLFKIFVKGKGGHGSMPHQGVDASLVGASILLNLQSVASREINPLEPSVVSVGIFKSGKSFNVIPGDAYIEGTTRCFSKEVNDGLEEQIRRIAENTAKAYRAEARVEYRQLVDPVINDVELSRIARNSVASIMGEDANIMFEKTMAGEDFALYSRQSKSVFALVGTKNEKKHDFYPHHHPKFDIDEDALVIAAALHAKFAMDFLNQQ